MEEALRLAVQVTLYAHILGFNPCFNGRGVKTYRISHFWKKPKNVSILVLMEEALRQISSGEVKPTMISFQSLF